MQEKPPWGQDVLERFRGHRILVSGWDSAVKEQFLEELGRYSRMSDADFEVEEDLRGITSQDYVILCGTGTDKREESGLKEYPGAEKENCSPEKTADAGNRNNEHEAAGKEERPPEVEETLKYPWIRPKKGEGEYLRPWQKFRELAQTLCTLAQAKPMAAVFVSDSSVYGKLFGDPHPLPETELGYVCSTDADEQDAQCLRTLEHLCGRLAKECGLAIRIVRVPINTGAINGITAFGSGSGMVEASLRVLLDGIPGEPYNIPGTAKGSWDRCGVPGGDGASESFCGQTGMGETAGKSSRSFEGRMLQDSFLSPFEVVLDLGKLEGLKRKEGETE